MKVHVPVGARQEDLDRIFSKALGFPVEVGIRSFNCMGTWSGNVRIRLSSPDPRKWEDNFQKLEGPTSVGVAAMSEMFRGHVRLTSLEIKVSDDQIADLKNDLAHYKAWEGIAD